MTLNQKRFFICADDYAQSKAISAGILELLESGRLSATGVMTTSPRWFDDAPALGRINADCAVGLHLDLTHPSHRPLGGLGNMLIRSHLRLLPRRALESACYEQIDRFVQVMGRLPDFLDGHQHVHALPQVREAFAGAIDHFWSSQSGVPSRPWARATDRLDGRTDTPFKAWVVSIASRGFSARMAEAGVPVSVCLGGLYSLCGRPFRPLLQSWLNDLPDGTWLMTHPGSPALGDLSDPIRQARAVEYAHLRSNEFLEDLSQSGAVVFRGPIELLPKG